MISVVALLLVLAPSLASAAKEWSGIKVVEDFLSEDEIASFRVIDANEKGRYDSRTHGRALLEDHVVRRLEQAGAIAPGLRATEMHTSVLTETSTPHKDAAFPAEGGQEKIADEDNIVFVFLNDNPKAKFVYGDKSVPVVAGSMVAFDGHLTFHNTEIEDGEVHLLGPFESRKLVWSGLAEDSPCGCTICPCPGDGGGVFGDPHFKTWSGKKYDFHGQCDLELISDPKFMMGKGLEISIRTKIVRQWSYIDSVAIRINGDILEVQGGGAEQKYWFNKQYQGELTEMAGLPVSYKKRHSKGHSYAIDLGDHGAIEVKTWKEFVRVDFRNPTAHLYGNTVGLLGKFPSGEMLARDGVTIIDDPVEFGKEWQMHSMLFHEGRSLDGACLMPEDIQTSTKRRRLGEAKVTETMAVLACQHAHVEEEDLDACIFDVLGADDIDVAGAY